jgi:hypothetical protein
MGLLECPDCGGKVSDQAPACPHCGRPMSPGHIAPRETEVRKSEGQTKCPFCDKFVVPVVTCVGGGSCSFGRREKWTCPSCKRTIHRSGCFVATVAYGDEDAIEVRFLRVFRDRVLRQRRIGRVVIWLYYRWGPCAAALVQRVPLLSRIARRFLDLIVDAIEKRVPFSRASIRCALQRHSRAYRHDEDANTYPE